MGWKHPCPFLKIEKMFPHVEKKYSDCVHYWLKFLSQNAVLRNLGNFPCSEKLLVAALTYTHQTVNIRHTNISPLTTSERICILVFGSNSVQWYLIRIKKIDENRTLRKILLCPKIDILLYFLKNFAYSFSWK